MPNSLQTVVHLEQEVLKILNEALTQSVKQEPVQHQREAIFCEGILAIYALTQPNTL